MAADKVSFAGPDGTLEGFLALPEGAGKAPAVVLVQEWWGLNEHVKSLSRRLAAAGFVVLAPDLYHGTIAKDADEAGKLMNALDTAKAVGEIGAAAAYLRQHARGNGKVGVTGFCLGGALTLAAACHLDGLAAAVPFYGVPPADKVDYARVTAPILGHFAQHDDWVTPARVAELKAALAQHGKAAQIESYDASHAFVNDTRPEVYSAESAAIAWVRTVDFLRQHVG